VPSNAEQDNCSTWLRAELELIRPRILIPVGRLAMSRFLPNLPLDQLVGRAHHIVVDGRGVNVIPLPHPSGASSWIHEGNHPQLLEDAIALIGRELAEVGIGCGPSDRNVA